MVKLEIFSGKCNSLTWYRGLGKNIYNLDKAKAFLCYSSVLVKNK